MIELIAFAVALACAKLPAQEAPHADAQPTGVITVEPRSGSGVLAITSDLAPNEQFEFVTCEALVIDGKTSELYPMKLEPKDWKHEGSIWSFTWDFPNSVRLDFRATPGVEHLGLEYALTNGSPETLKQVLMYPCLPTAGAPSFYPGTSEQALPDLRGRKARVGRNDYSELYARLFLWSEGQRFAFKDSKLAATEKHLAFMLQGETPVEFAWFVNAGRTFDLPLLAVASNDGKLVAGFALDSTIQASSNVGDGRACLHLVPFVRALEPGKQAKVQGTFYWMKGGPDDLLARYRRDAPRPAAK